MESPGFALKYSEMSWNYFTRLWTSWNVWKLLVTPWNTSLKFLLRSPGNQCSPLKHLGMCWNPARSSLKSLLSSLEPQEPVWNPYILLRSHRNILKQLSYPSGPHLKFFWEPPNSLKPAKRPKTLWSPVKHPRNVWTRSWSSTESLRSPLIDTGIPQKSSNGYWNPTETSLVSLRPSATPLAPWDLFWDLFRYALVHFETP